MDLPILHTKLHIPQLYLDGLIDRPRLTQTLNEGLARKLILISAPAGAGKTTLVSQWLHPIARGQGSRGAEENFTPAPLPPRSSAQFAWLSLDEGDNDFVRFWSYVIAALRTVQAGIGEQALALLQAPQAPPFEAVLTLLINDMASLAEPVVLILDDYHLIENPPVHTALIFLVDYMSSQLHLVISSRSDPPLPLARWRVRRQLLELRAEDLRFTPDEAARFLNQFTGLTLSAENIVALEVKTEGWVAGLQLAAISLQGRSDIDSFIRNFNGHHQYILDYVTEEVLRQQPEDIQTFLLQTSILDRLTGPLCDAITGRTDSQAMLEQLAQKNLFVVALDDQGQWYRYHQLFIDLLRHTLQRTAYPLSRQPANGASASIADLHCRAAAWYEQAGFADEAIRHAAAAQNFEMAGRLILRNVKKMFIRGESSVVLRWLKLLPEPWLRTQLKLNLCLAWLLFMSGHFDEVQPRLAEVEQLWSLKQESLVEADGLEEEFESQHIPAIIMGLQAQMALIKGDLNRAIALAEQAMALLAEADFAVRAIISQNLVAAYWINGNIEKANRLLDDLTAVKPTADTPAMLISLSSMAELKHMQGRYRQSFSLYQRILQLAGEQEMMQIPFVAAQAHAEMGHLLYEWNDLAGAETHLYRGIKLGEQGGGFRALLSSYFVMIRVFLAQKKLTEALETIQKLEQYIQKLDSTFFQKPIMFMWVNIWLAQGDLEAVTRWIQINGLRADQEINGLDIFIYVAFARALMALGDNEAAAILLSKLFFSTEMPKQKGVVNEILVLQALNFQAQNKNEQALVALKPALAAAEPEGLIRTFVNEGPPMAALLLKLLDARQREATDALPSVSYINTLLQALGVNGPALVKTPSPALLQALVEPLTERELEVLQLMATGLSNQEMADKLVVARSTLKSHIKNIYSKLEVNNRIQAIARGNELKLL